MKRICCVVALMMLFICGAITQNRADIVDEHGPIVTPQSRAYIDFLFLDDDWLPLLKYNNVTQLVFSDGYVLPLDMSDGSRYTLEVSLDGTLAIVIKRYVDGTVDQWISTFD